MPWRDVFGGSVSIDGDRLIVGASRPTTNFLLPIAYVFSRNGELSEWSLDTSLNLPGAGFDANRVVVSISDDTAVGGTDTSQGGGRLVIFQADRQDPTLWTEIGRKAAPGHVGRHRWRLTH